MAFSAFALAILAGLFAGAETDVVLTRALASMVLCYAAGWLSGAAIEHVLGERILEERQSDSTGAKPQRGAPRAPNGGQRNATAA